MKEQEAVNKYQNRNEEMETGKGRETSAGPRKHPFTRRIFPLGTAHHPLVVRL